MDRFQSVIMTNVSRRPEPIVRFSMYSSDHRNDQTSPRWQSISACQVWTTSAIMDRAQVATKTPFLPSLTGWQNALHIGAKAPRGIWWIHPVAIRHLLVVTMKTQPAKTNQRWPLEACCNPCSKFYFEIKTSRSLTTAESLFCKRPFLLTNVL